MEANSKTINYLKEEQGCLWKGKNEERAGQETVIFQKENPCSVYPLHCISGITLIKNKNEK